MTSEHAVTRNILGKSGSCAITHKLHERCKSDSIPIPIVDVLSRATELVPQAHGDYTFGVIENGGNFD